MIAEAALGSRLSADQIISFDTVPEVIDYLKEHLSEGNVVLLKGSHGLRNGYYRNRIGGYRMKEGSLALALSTLSFMMAGDLGWPTDPCPSPF